MDVISRTLFSFVVVFKIVNVIDTLKIKQHFLWVNC